MNNVGMTIELNAKGDKITGPSFGLYDSPAEYSTMGLVVLDLTCLAYQPNLRERSARLKQHVTFRPVGAKISISSSHTKTGRRRR